MNQELTSHLDLENLKSLQNGDWGSFERIYDKFWSKLYLSAYSILRDKQACEDIVQDVLVQLWLKKDSAQIDSLPAYLHAAIRYQVFKVVKSGKMTLALPDEIELTSERTEAEDLLATQDLNQLLDDHIARLPEKCREVFILSRKNNLSIAEIADRLHISTKTVENHITNALGRLRISMGEFLFWLIVTLPSIWD
ncbi:MAG TPA: RNA polymerase sigma-70 factor [Dyadobacter sp.]|jgi:RNA polymerase sigma-70 factor (ECF subfamily)|nr:RNA polymerase sigma-70 factor [Dyadobacter sp.]